MMPESMRKTRNASIVLSRVEVVSLYAFHKDRRGLCDEPAVLAGGAVLVAGMKESEYRDGSAGVSTWRGQV